MRYLKYVALCVVVSIANNLVAQQAKPCDSPAHRQFDFWLGDWTVYHTQADTIVGHNSIRSILNGCVLEENWTGASGFQGKSFNTYNPADSTWNQVWVDGSGARYTFTGHLEDQVMALKGETMGKKGKVLFSLNFHYDSAKDEVRQIWKMSTDNAASWSTIFDGTYRKDSKD